MERYSDYKLVISNNIFDFYHYYEASVCYGKKENKRVRIRRVKINRPENRKLSLMNSKRTLKRIINTNSVSWENDKGIFPKFLTLTFKDNIQDIKLANYEFKKFILRLNYHLWKNKKTF